MGLALGLSQADVRRVVQEKLFPKAEYNPHPAQMKIHTSQARHRVASCGRRFGKSVIGGMELVTEAYITGSMLGALERTGKRREFWIVGPEYTDAAKEFRVAYNMLLKLGAPLDRPGTYHNERTGDMQISMYDGKFIILGKSASKPERLVGEGLNGVVMAEAAKQKEVTWVRYIRPMLADFRGWSLHTSTPEGKNHFYKHWNAGQSTEELEWESWRMPSWRNPYVYRQDTTDKQVRIIQNQMASGKQITARMQASIDPEIWSQLRDLTAESFKQEIAADFTEFVGRVFKEFDEEVHVKDFRWNPEWPTYAAVDYGFTNPFVFLLLQVNPYDGGVWVVDEMYETGLTIDEIVVELKSRDLIKPGLRDLYPDPASPGDTRTLESKLQLNGVGGTGGEIKLRLRAIRQALRTRNLHLAEGHPLRCPRLFINRRCVNTIREFNDYRYPKTYAEAGTNPPENPLKKDDHTPEALGRFFAGYFGGPDEGEEGGVRVSTARMG